MKKIILYFDGACTDTKRDGDLGLGFHAHYEGEELGSIFKFSESAGIGTNNEAEYKAMIRGMEELVKRSLTDNVQITGDSQVIIKQMTKEYACKELYLRRLNITANKLLTNFTNITFKHLPREENQLADDLSKQGTKRTLIDYYNYKF